MSQQQDNYEALLILVCSDGGAQPSLHHLRNLGRCSFWSYQMVWNRPFDKSISALVHPFRQLFFITQILKSQFQYSKTNQNQVLEIEFTLIQETECKADIQYFIEIQCYNLFQQILINFYNTVVLLNCKCFVKSNKLIKIIEMNEFNRYINNKQANDNHNNINNLTQQEVLRSNSNKQQTTLYTPIYASSLKHKFLTKNAWRDFSPKINSQDGYRKFSLNLLLDEVKSQRVQSRILQQKQLERHQKIGVCQFQLPLGDQFESPYLSRAQQKQSRKITACLKIKHWINQYLQSKATNEDLLNCSKNKQDYSQRLSSSHKMKPLTREDLLVIYAFDRIEQFTMRSPLSNNKNYEHEHETPSQNKMNQYVLETPPQNKMNQYVLFRRQQILEDYMSSSNIIQEQMTRSQALHQGIHKLRGQVQFLLRMNKRESFLNIKTYSQERYRKIQFTLNLIEKAQMKVLIRSVFNLFKFQALTESNVLCDENYERLQQSAVDSSILSSPLFQSSLGVKHFSKGIYFGHNFNQEYEKLTENEQLFGYQEEQKAEVNREAGFKKIINDRIRKIHTKIEQEPQDIKQGSSHQQAQTRNEKDHSHTNPQNGELNVKKIEFASSKPHKKKSENYVSNTKQSFPKQLKTYQTVLRNPQKQKTQQRQRTVVKERPKKSHQNQVTVNSQHTTPPIQQRRHLIVRTNLYEYPLNDNQFDITYRDSILPDFNKSLSINSRSVNTKGHPIYHLIPDFIKFQQPDTDSCYPGAFIRNSFMNFKESKPISMPIPKPTPTPQRIYSPNNISKKSIYDSPYQKTIIQRPRTPNQRTFQGNSNLLINQHKQDFYTSENSNNASRQTLRPAQTQNLYNGYHYYTPRSQSPIILPSRNSFSPMNLPMHSSKIINNNGRQKINFLPQEYRNQPIISQQKRTRINAETSNTRNGKNNSPTFNKLESANQKKYTRVLFRNEDKKQMKKLQQIPCVNQNSSLSEYQIFRRAKTPIQQEQEARNQFRQSQQIMIQKTSSMKNIHSQRVPIHIQTHQANPIHMQRNQDNKILLMKNIQQDRTPRKGIRSAKKIMIENQSLEKAQNAYNLKTSHSGKILLTLKPAQKQSINRIGNKN